MAYLVKAETKDGLIGMSETFKSRFFAMSAVKSALKAHMNVTIEELL